MDQKEAFFGRIGSPDLPQQPMFNFSKNKMKTIKSLNILF